RRSGLGEGDDGAGQAFATRLASAGTLGLLAGSMGEMPAYYPMADVAILGGSLAPFGGQNLIEACPHGLPVVLVPLTFHFAEAAQAVATALEIAGDAPRRARMGERALAFAGAHRGASERILARLLPLVDAAA